MHDGVRFLEHLFSIQLLLEAQKGEKETKKRKKPEVKQMATRIEDLHILMITKIIAF